MNSAPLLKYLTDLIKPFGSVKKRLVVSAVNANNGEYVTFKEDMPFDDISKYVVASASIPFIFPHTVIDDYVLMDGGTAWNVNLVSAV